MFKISVKNKTLFIAAISFMALSLPASSAYAQNATQGDLVPAKSSDSTTVTIDEGKHTHPPIRLTPDKSEIITLDKDAASIIIGNPNHLSILADSSKRLVLVPRAPGASHFMILGHDGNIIMQRHAIIASPKKEYVRIRRSCANAETDDCQETRVFYCPDMCHEISMGSEEAAGGAPDVEAAARGAIQDENLNEQDPTE